MQHDSHVWRWRRFHTGREVILKLVSMLPPVGDTFAIEDRKAWLSACEAAMRITYRTSGAVNIEIK